MGMKIAMLCTHHLKSPYRVGSQHIYDFLSARFDVDYYSHPVSPLHLLFVFRSDIRQRVRKVLSGNDSEVVPFSWWPAGDIWPFNTRQSLSWSVKLSSVQEQFYDVVYIDNIFYAYYLERIAFDKLIFRVNDYHANLPGWDSELTYSLAQMIGGRADAIYYSAHTLKDYAQSLASNDTQLRFLSNGISKVIPLAEADLKNAALKRFNNILEQQKPIVIYCGAMGPWFDEELVDSAARSLSYINFVLIGDRAPSTQRDNVHFLGTCPNQICRHMMSKSSVGIIPFKSDSYSKLIQHINPIKLYEYMAAGIPVVSTSWAEMCYIDSPAILVDNSRGFINEIQAVAMDNQRDSNDYVSFANDYLWSSLLKKSILKDINSRVEPI